VNELIGRPDERGAKMNRKGFSSRGTSIVLVIFAIILFVWIAILVFSGR